MQATRIVLEDIGKSLKGCSFEILDDYSMHLVDVEEGELIETKQFIFVICGSILTILPPGMEFAEKFYLADPNYKDRIIERMHFWLRNQGRKMMACKVCGSELVQETKTHNPEPPMRQIIGPGYKKQLVTEVIGLMCPKCKIRYAADPDKG